MALGKRKRRDEIEDYNVSEMREPEGIEVDLQTLFQQHFEAEFQPLESLYLPIKQQELVRSPSPSEEDISDWDGLPDEDGHGPEIVELGLSSASNAEPATEELKSFMVVTIPHFSILSLTEVVAQGAKPPLTSTSSTEKKKQPQAADAEESASDAAHLRKDLELQRLLKESHLLEPQSSLVVSGKNRHRALDLRLQDLGSKTSIYAQQKMPMAHRKGIAAQAAEKDRVRRREAEENGVTLEKAAKPKKGGTGRRERALGLPSVGKFHGGMLRLSKKDVADIQGPKTPVKRRR